MHTRRGSRITAQDWAQGLTLVVSSSVFVFLSVLWTVVELLSTTSEVVSLIIFTGALGALTGYLMIAIPAWLADKRNRDER